VDDNHAEGEGNRKLAAFDGMDISILFHLLNSSKDERKVRKE